ncbi:MAG: hypothetical protein IH991_24925 [Planctomycetes bacterium]|nr:hypothetical protein [Planctomycetota bacterium]
MASFLVFMGFEFSDTLLQEAEQRRIVAYFEQTNSDDEKLWGVDRHFGLQCSLPAPRDERTSRGA